MASGYLGAALLRRKGAERINWLEPVYDAMDTIIDQTFSKIDHQPQLGSDESQVGQGLGLEDRVVLGYGFAFNNHEIIDQDIDT